MAVSGPRSVVATPKLSQHPSAPALTTGGAASAGADVAPPSKVVLSTLMQVAGTSVISAVSGGGPINVLRLLVFSVAKEALLALAKSIVTFARLCATKIVAGKMTKADALSNFRSILFEQFRAAAVSLYRKARGEISSDLLLDQTLMGAMTSSLAYRLINGFFSKTKDFPDVLNRELENAKNPPKTVEELGGRLRQIFKK